MGGEGRHDGLRHRKVQSGSADQYRSGFPAEPCSKEICTGGRHCLQRHGSFQKLYPSGQQRGVSGDVLQTTVQAFRALAGIRQLYSGGEKRGAAGRTGGDDTTEEERVKGRGIIWRVL